MKVLVAGATGALGRQTVPQLIAAGHEVTGMSRSETGAAAIRAMGADAVLADALDRDRVKAAVAAAAPEVIVHELTALKIDLNFKKMNEGFAPTNRLRIEGTDNLLAAARATGVRRMVAQSFIGLNLARTGGPTKTEDDPVEADPPPSVRLLTDALNHLERVVTGDDAVEGLALRYGGFYGPGTMLAADGSMLEMVRKRRVPVIGSGNGVWSFIHVHDAAAATVRAVEQGAPGIYQIADDEPAPVKVWLPELAAAIGAKPPRHAPKWLAKLAVGEAGVKMFTEMRGAENAKAKRELDWTLRYPSWRQGFREGL